ncbi:MAG: tetratricopeptide repeat protein, partial [Planctomycetes bacterium]|nr:tetratricopeptide repeat protein [Planctomycetota bacterium]
EVAPVGGGQDRTIAYKAVDDNMAPNPIIVELSMDDGVTYKMVATGQPNKGTFPWRVPQNVNVTNARLKIRALDVLGNEGMDISDAFRIDSKAPVTSVTIVGIGEDVKQHFEVQPTQKTVIAPSVVPQRPTVDTTALLKQAENAERMEDFVGSRKLIDEVLSKDGNNFKAHSLLGKIYFQEGKLSNAIESYSRAIALNPTFQDSNIGLGLCYFVMGQKIKDKNPDATVDYYKKAAMQYEAAIEILPDTWDEYFHLGYIYAHLSKYDEAIKCLKKAIPLSENNGNAYWYLGQIYQIKGEKPVAIEMFEKALENFKKDSEYYKKAEAKIRELKESP